MDHPAVVNEYESAGRRLLDRLAQDGFDLRAAGWVQTEYDGRPYLYLVTSKADDGDTLPAYLDVQRAMQSLPRSAVGLSEVKVIPTDDPLAVALARYTERYSTAPMDSTVYADSFLGVSVQRPVFVYALPNPVPTPA